MNTKISAHEARHLEKIAYRGIDTQYFIEYELSLDYGNEAIRQSGHSSFIGTAEEFREAIAFISRFKVLGDTEQLVAAEARVCGDRSASSTSNNPQ